MRLEAEKLNILVYEEYHFSFNGKGKCKNKKNILYKS